MMRTWISVCLATALSIVSACRSNGSAEASERSAFDAGAAHPSSENAAVSAASTPETTSGSTRRATVSGRAELGEIAPSFTLSDVHGRTVSLSQYKGRTIVLEWFNPRCDYCQEAHREGGVLREMPERWAREGVVWLSINSQGPGEAGSDVEENRAFMRENEMRTVVLMDPTGVVGRAYEVKVTPQMFVISERGLLVYVGALDNAPRGVVPAEEVKTNYVDSALRDLRSGHAVLISEKRAYGCGVKYAR
jgi:peroxiredoxin